MFKILYNTDRTQVSARDLISPSAELSDIVYEIKRDNQSKLTSDIVEFTNSDLVDNILTINHGKGTANITPSWVNPSGVIKSLDSITTISTTQIIINFGDAIDEGTHKIEYTYKP